MFEYHGWATTRIDAVDAVGDEHEQVRDEVWIALAHQAERIRAANGVAYLDHRNSLHSFTVAGQNNHRAEVVLEVFRWIADHACHSYGLLYIRDDEDVQREADYSNAFRVWRLARGTLHEYADPFLSPYVPTVELPFAPQSNLPAGDAAQ